MLEYKKAWKTYIALSRRYQCSFSILQQAENLETRLVNFICMLLAVCVLRTSKAAQSKVNNGIKSKATHQSKCTISYNNSITNHVSL